jgi:aspartyl-tRNA(Asn)/glutamyl-tRNA(Gln) amidotransferase subunit B
MRGKEEAHDYRYFPDPDLLPLEFTQEFVDEIAASLPELPDEKKARFIADYGLSPYDAGLLVSDRDVADYFEAVAKGRDAKLAVNWVMGDLSAHANAAGKTIADLGVTADQLGAVIDLISDGTVSGKIAKQVLEIVVAEGGDPRRIVEERGLKQVTDTGAIEAIVDTIIADNPDQVAQVRDKPKAIGWFVGQVMKASAGKANPQAVNEILKAKLGLE